MVLYYLRHSQTNKVWQYINLSKKKDNLLKLKLLSRPILRDVLPMAILIIKLDLNQLTVYNQLYAKYKDDLRVHQKQK